jgi:DNA repair exonuclease SbcCD nuclease subunit
MNSGQAVTGIDIKSLRFANLVLLGHVHAPQTLGKGVHYVGSPFQQNWGEAGEPKRVAIVDTDACEVNWIPLVGYPEYRQVSVEQYEQIDINKTEDRFKVVITNPEEAQKFYSIPTSGAAEPVYSYNVAAATMESNGTQTLTQGWGAEDVMLRYLRRNPISGLSSALPDDELLQIGKDIMAG